MEKKSVVVRDVAFERPFSFKRFFFQWEWMLIIVFIAINIMNISLSPNYLVFDNIIGELQMYTDKAILVLPMMMVILLGEIDLSIASTMALSGVIMGVCYQAGIPMPASMGIGVFVGGLCGFINGFILTKFKELSSMIVTLSTMIIYRGIASIILKDGSVGKFPDWFKFIGWGNIGGIPVILIFFVIEFLVFAYIIHYTKFGRNLYAMGNNITTAEYSGIKVNKIKIIVYTLMGVFAAISAIVLMSKMGNIRPSMAKGYELDIIAMVVLGGVSNNGGKGKAIGVLIATLIICLLRYGLGIINVPSQMLFIIIGFLLIIAVAIPNLKTSFGGLKIFKQSNK